MSADICNSMLCFVGLLCPQIVRLTVSKCVAPFHSPTSQVQPRCSDRLCLQLALQIAKLIDLLQVVHPELASLVDLKAI